MLRIRRRLIVWVLFAVGVPLVAEGLHWAADTIEARHGAESPAARRLRRAGRLADGLRRRRAIRDGRR